MKKPDLFFVVLIYICFTLGCSSQSYVVSENGDKATITLIDDSEINCEIICFYDTMLVYVPIKEENIRFMSQVEKYYSIMYKDIKSISIAGFDGKGWGTSIWLFQVVPAGLLAVAAASVETNGLIVLFISSIPAILTSLFYSASDGETPQWNNKEDQSKIHDLSIYARYPDKLSRNEIMSLIEKSNK